MLILAVAATFYYLRVYAARHRSGGDVAYVLPETLAVYDTAAEIRSAIASLQQGDRVEVLDRSKNWAKVRLPDRRTGWVERKDLIPPETYEAGQQLVKEVEALQPQASGHVSAEVNLHLEPSREALSLAALRANQRMEVFERRLVERPPAAGAPVEAPPRTQVREAWYLVRAGSRAGWILGRLVTLDIPPGISSHAQGFNLVAWFVLDTVNDEGRPVPQYLVADRVGSEECDFTHVRVFTWWKKRQEYVTAYVEGGLVGYFPIRVTERSGVPYFRLRLVDEDGVKFQKVYALHDTMTRIIGRVDGWESDAMPTARARPLRLRRRAPRRATQVRR